jgi:hypothetical protein
MKSQKEKDLDNIMELISKCYLPSSGVYSQVRAALLKKLSSVEMGQLWAMIATSEGRPAQQRKAKA